MKLNFKTLTFGSMVLASVQLFLSSCNLGNKEETSYEKKDSKEVAEEKNDAILEGRKQERDAQFLVDAAEISLEEMELAELAKTKSTDPQVKKVSEMVMNDHTKTFQELKNLASKKGISIPTTVTEDGKEAYVKLSTEKPSDFKEEYCYMLVRQHKKAINKFENASKNASDAEIKEWASASLPRLKSNLDEADMCREKEKKAAASFR